MNDTQNPVSTETCPPCSSAPVLPAAAPIYAAPNTAAQLAEASAARRAALLPDAADSVFALVWSALGYGYIFCVFEGMFADALWRMGAFALCYATATCAYFRAKKIRVPKTAWFWLAALCALSVPLFYFSARGELLAWQLMGLHALALYWPMAACGILADGQTGALLPLDALRGALILPFANFFAHARAVWQLLRKTRAGRALATAGLGLCCAAPVLALVLPLLSSADASFALALTAVRVWFDRNLLSVAFRLALSLPVTAYLYGLAFACVHRDSAAQPNPQAIRAAAQKARVAPALTVGAAAGVLCVVYLIFIGMQGQYLFGAFLGQRPAAMTYAEYARSGFFELCRVAAVNLAVWAAAEFFCRRTPGAQRVLRGCTAALCVLSLLLTATAFSKMGLYIAAYGLTLRRVLASAGLVWFAGVFLLLLVRLKKPFSAVRAATVLGTVIFCVVCALPLRTLIPAYNNARVEAGTLARSEMGAAAQAEIYGSDS